MILRASTLNSSGVVELSRSPRRLSPTSGWLLTLSGTVLLDQPPNRVDCHLQHPLHVLRVAVLNLAGTELVYAEGDRARAPLAQARYHEQGRRLHVVAQDARPRPHLELVAQVKSWHLVGHQVRIQGIHA